MNYHFWSKDHSLWLSQFSIVIFSLALFALDAGCFWITRWFCSFRLLPPGAHLYLMITIYLCSISGWMLLYHLWQLLSNIKKEQVFISENVRLLRRVSWHCLSVCLICLVSTCYYFPFFIASAAAGFVTLIVRIVKNIFDQAIAMKSELDLTI